VGRPAALLAAVASAAVLAGLAAGCSPAPEPQDPRPTGERDDAEGPRSRGPVLVIAHRGASAYAPHDTVAAAREAAARGADTLEVDVRQTRDGHLVALFHSTLAPTTDVEQVFPGRAPWRVETFTLAQVQRLDAGSWFGERFAGERVPTLPEIARVAAASGLSLIAEVKSPQVYPGVEERIAREVSTHPRRYREIESFDWPFLRSLAERSLPVRIGLTGTPPLRRLGGVASYADAVNPGLGTVSQTYVDRAHDAGLEVKVWSLNSRAAMRRGLGLGVDGIYTHRPDVLRELLRSGGTPGGSGDPGDSGDSGDSAE